jgi:predicted deacylase
MSIRNAFFTSYKFDTLIPGPHLLITAGVHGDEYEPMVAAMELAARMQGIMKSGKLTVVPVVNESAYLRSARCGEDGLDLARTCPGDANGSITERVAAEISNLIKQANFYIDLHTGGFLFDIYPLAGYMLHEDAAILQTQREMAESFGLPVIWGTDPYAQGRTLSVARDAGVPAIYVEYGGGSSGSADIIQSYVEGCERVIHYLLNVSSQPAAKGKSVFWVEDHRVNNGHLQTKMPSPATGVFIASVTPGDCVETGDEWGAVHDPLSGRLAKVEAGENGIVLFTRASAPVKTGESLGGILPITEPGKIVFHAS